MKKITRVISTTFLACLLVLTTACSEKSSLLTSDDLKAFSENLDNNQYNTAIKIYDDLSPEDMTNANKLIAYEVESIMDGYYDGKIDYSSAKRALEAYYEFNYSNDIRDAYNEMQENHDADESLSEAKNYMEKEQYGDVIGKLVNIPAAYRNYKEASELLEKCIPLYRESTENECDAFMEKEDYRAVFSRIYEAKNLLPDDSAWAELDLKYKNGYIDYMTAKVDEYNTAENYTGAMDFVLEAGSLLEGFYFEEQPKEVNDLYEKESNLYCESIVKSLDNLVSENKYTEAIDAIYGYQNLFVAYFGSEMPEQFADIVADCQDKYCEQCMEEAKGLAEKKDYQGAVNALDGCVNDERYATVNKALANSANNMMNEYMRKVPIKLYDCTVIDESFGGSYREVTNVTNQFGHIYANAAKFSGWNENFILYNTDERFTKLDFTIWGYADRLRRDDTASVYIYCDGVLTESIENIGHTTDPVDYSIDLTGCKKLKIVFENAGWMDVYFGNAMLSN